jgi:iron complex outermembrane receptor protein
MKSYQHLILLMSALSALPLRAQDSPNSRDSVREYKLGDIIVTDSRTALPTIQPSTTNEIPYRQIRTADATSVAQLEQYIPAGHIQTNSRGETLLYMRGAGERQTALFLDGALINIPWDNRVDLSLIPADLLGKMTISKGAHSILYGANTLGGAINMTTIERTGDGFGGIVRLQAGEGGSKLASLLHDGRIGDFSYIVYGGYTGTDGFLLPGSTDDTLKYQNGRRLRTNTDMERISLFGRAEYAFSPMTKLGLSVQHIDADKGVAPEEHKSLSRTRFWRYGLWRRSLVTLSGEHIFNDERTVTLRGSLWFDNFAQRIDQYTNVTYTDILRHQDDEDRTLGARISLLWEPTTDDAITLSVNGYNSTHDETIAAPGQTVSPTTFEQMIYSAGAEYRRQVDNWIFTLGATLDGAATPQTGVFPAQDGRNDLAAMFGIVFRATQDVDLFASTGRKTRYATPREQFSAALGKFITNPDLRPETGTLTELGVRYTGSTVQIQSAFFGNLYTDLIATTVVQDTMEQRINLGKSIAAGWELAFSWSPLEDLRINGHYSYIYTRAEDENGEYNQNLEYKPEQVALLAARYSLPYGFAALAELQLTGRQYGEDQPIDAFTLVNLRLSHNFSLSGTQLELFVRLNNTFDTYALSQIGLPDPGRTLNGGIMMLF